MKKPLDLTAIVKFYVNSQHPELVTEWFAGQIRVSFKPGLFGGNMETSLISIIPEDKTIYYIVPNREKFWNTLTAHPTMPDFFNILDVAIRRALKNHKTRKPRER